MESECTAKISDQRRGIDRGTITAISTLSRDCNVIAFDRARIFRIVPALNGLRTGVYFAAHHQPGVSLSSQNVPSDGVAGRLYHFVIAVWRLKAAQFDQREVLGSHS